MASKFINTIISKKWTILLYLLVFVLINLLAYSYFKTENGVYFWDTSAYWKNAIDLLNTLHQSKGAALNLVIESLKTDYNYLPIVPLLPFLEILGTGRTVFGLTILNLYIIPFALICSFAFVKLFKIKSVYLGPLAAFITCFFPAVLIPVFDGRVDGIGLLIISLIFLLYAYTGLSRYRHFIIVGILICLLIVMRRYFAFWALGFFAAYAILAIAKSATHNKSALKARFYKDLLKPFLSLLIAGLTIVALMLIFFKDLFMRYFGENYSDTYSAYLLGDALNQGSLFMQHFGLIPVIALITGLVIVFKAYKKSSVFAVTIFIWIQTLIIFSAFTRTQTFGVHHYYMLVPIFIWSLFVIIAFLNKKKYGLLYTLIVAVVITGLSLYSFTGSRVAAVNTVHRYLFGAGENVRPIVRTDMEQLDALTAYLETEMLPSDYVYVLSSSETFNEDLLRNIHLPTYPTINISGVSHIDKRDGFPNYFFDAQYIIIADPVQTHVEPSGQMVITVPAKTILNGDAKNLIELKSFTIDNGVTLRIFKKIAPYEESYINSLRETFREHYPDYPKLNSINPLN